MDAQMLQKQARNGLILSRLRKVVKIRPRLEMG